MVSNATLKLFEEQFAKAVQDKIDAEHKNDSVKIAEAEKAAQDARDAVAIVKQQEEVTVEISSGGGNLPRKMSDGKLIQTKRGVIKDNERGARENPDVVKTYERQRPTRSRQHVRERSRT